MTDWLKAKFGRMRVSTIVLVVAFVALFWVHEAFQPEPPEAPAPAVVPPGFVPDPNYTWVPRTNVRRPKEPTTTTTTSPTDSTTTSPTSPTETTPTTTVVDPDGFGPLPPTTQTIVTPTPVTTTPTLPGPTPTTTTPPG
jgi:hypothetical protein